MAASCSMGMLCDTDLCGACFQKLLPPGQRVARPVPTTPTGRDVRFNMPAPEEADQAREHGEEEQQGTADDSADPEVPQTPEQDAGGGRGHRQGRTGGTGGDRTNATAGKKRAESASPERPWKKAKVAGKRVTQTTFNPPEKAAAPQHETRQEQAKRQKLEKREREKWIENNCDHADLCFNTLCLREGGEARALNRLLIRLGEERPEALQQAMGLSAMTAIREKGKADVAQMLDAAVFTEKATLDLMFDVQNPINSRQVAKQRDRLNYIQLPDDEDGRPRYGRVMLSLPPQPNHKRDPDAVSKQYMESIGFKPTAHGAIPDAPLPFMLKDPRLMKKVGDKFIEDKEFLMPAENEEGFEIEACAFKAKEVMGEVLDICEKDDNLLPLIPLSSDNSNPLLAHRRMLMISDGYKHDSTKGATATSFSSPDMKRLLKHTRYLGDTCFAFGDDHHASMEAQVKVGGDDGILGMIESALDLDYVDDDGLPTVVRGTPWEEYSRYEVVIHPDVPRKDGSVTPCDLTFGADAANASALASMHGPTDKFYSCDKCTVARKDQTDDAKCAAAVPRTYAQTLALAHFNIYTDQTLGKLITKKKLSRKKFSICPAPGCGKRLDAASVRADLLRQAAMSRSDLAKEDLTHRKKHFGIHWLRRPYAPHENKKVARDDLHGLTNPVGNTIAVTFNAVPFEGNPCPKRLKANKFIRSKGIRIKTFRFPTSAPTKNSKPRRPPQGGDARKFLNHPLVLPELHKIFYEDELSAGTAEQLEDAAVAAEAVMATDAEQEQQARRGRGMSRASLSRPRPTAAGEGARPRAASDRAGSSSAHASDAASDASDADSARSSASGESSANETGDEYGNEGDDEGAEVCRANAEENERMEVAPVVEPRRQGGQVVGGAETSATCWLTLSEFQKKVYEDFDDRSPAERTRNGTEGQALGAKWANALDRHSGGNANWFYPHDAARHYKEDVEANGSRKRNGTSAHEAKNKMRRARKHRVFGGGMRKSTTTEHERNGKSVRCWDVPLKVPDRDADGKEIGTYHKVWYRKEANDPDFKALQRHEAITRRIEAEKPPPLLLEPRKQDVKADSDAAREDGRRTMKQGLQAIQRRVNRARDGEQSDV